MCFPVFYPRGHQRGQAQSPVPRGFYIYMSYCLLYIYTYLLGRYYSYRLIDLRLSSLLKKVASFSFFLKFGGHLDTFPKHPDSIGQTNVH